LHTPSDDDASALPEHPKGTIAILLIYAGFFAVGWAAFYVFIFLGRGATTH